jgi:hypothetical protein
MCYLRLYRLKMESVWCENFKINVDVYSFSSYSQNHLLLRA